MDRKERKEVDMHIHSNYSDGDCSIGELIRRIKKANLEVVALTDHDTVEGAVRFLDVCEREDVETLPGVEITTYDDFSKEEIHILGYGFNLCQLRDNYNQLLFHNRSVRRKNIWNVLDLYKKSGEFSIYSHDLESMFHLPANVNSMYWVNKARALHIRNLEGLDFAAAYERAKNETKKGAKFYYPNENVYASTNEAIWAIERTGGIAVWAHPAETISRLKKRFGSEKVARRLFEDSLKSFVCEGLAGLEVFSAFNSDEEEIKFLLGCCSRYNLLILGGSDYHGDMPDEHKPDRWLGRNGISYEEFLKIKKAISLRQ